MSLFYNNDTINKKQQNNTTTSDNLNNQKSQSVYLMFEENDERHHSIIQNELCLLTDDNNNNQSQQHSQLLSWHSDKASRKNAPINNNSNKIQHQSSAVVPNLTNVDEIFYLLSQKIAKYCQILADLTNCEVFYKAYLPLNKNSNKKKAKSLHSRSLYWGTHQMLFQFSHDQGIKYNKLNGDSLIKINSRSISTDINQLIEEILNAPLSSSSSNENKEKTPTTTTITINEAQKSCSTQLNNNNETIKLKDCCIYLNRLDDDYLTIDHYFNKFELKHNNLETDFMIGQDIIDENKNTNNNNNNNNNKSLSLNELPSDMELYSDQYTINNNHNSGKKTLNADSEDDENDDDDDDDDEEDDDEKDLLEKNCLNNNNSNNEINENDENYYNCEQCPSGGGYSYKHLTQLKVHELRAHFNLDLKQTRTCQKCGSHKYANDQIEFLKHSITCYFPNVYQCKTCAQVYDNYSQYLFHIRYIHTHVVYMCSICNRKYKHIKDLIDHDQLMHSKSLNYCEICFESFKSRKFLYEHYNKTHLNNKSSNSNNDKQGKEILINNNESEIESDNNDEIRMDQGNESIELERIQKQNNQKIVKEFQLINDQDNDEFVNNDNEEDEIEIEQEVHFTDKSNNNNNNNNKKSTKVHKNELIRGLIDRKHQCKWCSLRFYTKSQLKQHEQLHTNSVLNCPVCDKQFNSKDRLNGHMKCHMEPSLECKVCGKKFKRLCNLYNHELVHGLTEHAFMLCQFCGRGFRSRRDYQNHVIANHRDHLMKVDSEGTIIQDLNNNNFDNNNNINSKRTKKPSKKLSNSTINNIPINNSTPNNENENEQPPSDLNINDSADDTYFTRTGVNFDLEDFQFDENEDENILVDDQEIDDQEELTNDNNKINNKKFINNNNNNKIKIKKFKINNQIEVEEDCMSVHQSEQINQNYQINKANTSILANLFEESLS